MHDCQQDTNKNLARCCLAGRAGVTRAWPTKSHGLCSNITSGSRLLPSFVTNSMLLKRVQPRNTRYRQCYSRSHASPPRWYLHLCDSSTSTTIWARGLIVKRSVSGRGLQHMGGSVAGFSLDKIWYSVLCACVAVCRVHT